MNFFNEPYDVQVVLGLTLVGIPNTWDEIKLVGFIKSYSYAFGPNEVFIVSTFLENPTEGIRKAHITCNNLYSKQKLLKIRLIPVIVGKENKTCQIITVRPYCFWIKLEPILDPIPYMLPKYGSRDIAYELVEAKILLHKNNIHPSIVTCLMEYNLIPTDGSYWSASDAMIIWFGVKEQNVELFNKLQKLMEIVQETASNFEPYEYKLKDELVYSSNWNQLLIHVKSNNLSKTIWPWENIDHESQYTSPEYISYKRGRKNLAKKIGCIRYESNRKRWVVDLSYQGKRLQKCFHQTYYGLAGGLAEALKWRFSFLSESKAKLSKETEIRSLADILQKIMQLDIDKSKKFQLIEILKNPIEGQEKLLNKEEVISIIESKLEKLDKQSKLRRTQEIYESE